MNVKYDNSYNHITPVELAMFSKGDEESRKNYTLENFIKV